MGGQEALLPEPLLGRLKRCSIHRSHKCDAGDGGHTCPDTQMDREKQHSVVAKCKNGTRCWVQIPEQRLREEQEGEPRLRTAQSLLTD